MVTRASPVGRVTSPSVTCITTPRLRSMMLTASVV